MVKVEVVLEDKTLEQVVDADIASFEKFMLEKVDDSGPLMGPERAILKTYLWFKTHETVDETTVEEEEDVAEADDRSEV